MWKKVVPREKSFSESVQNEVKDHNDIIVFSASIAKFDRNSKIEINHNKVDGHAHSHSQDPTHSEGRCETAVVHVGVNDGLKDSN